MAEQPAALQLRLLQTVVEVAAEKNSTLVLPFPVELLRFLERSTPQGHEDPAEGSDTDIQAALTASLAGISSALTQCDDGSHIPESKGA